MNGWNYSGNVIARYLCLLCMFFSNCYDPARSQKRIFERERDKRVHAAIKKFNREMTAKGYYPAGIGEGIDHSNEKQNYIEITLDIDSLPDVDFARQVEVAALQQLLYYINSEGGIEDYVAEYPYPIKFINVAFVSRHREQGLFLVANFEEKIYYCQDEPNKPGGPSREILEESYEEAVRILDQQGVQPAA